MSIKIIRPRREITETCHALCFYRHGQQAGYDFDCDEAGNVDVESLNPDSRVNYERCLADGGKLYRKFVDSWDERYVEYPVARCHCGDEITLYGFTNECESCGRLYNASGQDLAPRSQWGAETGETAADIERPGDPFDSD